MNKKDIMPLKGSEGVKVKMPAAVDRNGTEIPPTHSNKIGLIVMNFGTADHLYIEGIYTDGRFKHFTGEPVAANICGWFELKR